MQPGHRVEHPPAAPVHNALATHLGVGDQDDHVDVVALEERAIRSGVVEEPAGAEHYGNDAPQDRRA